MDMKLEDSQNSSQNGVGRRGPRTPSPPYNRDRSRSPVNNRRGGSGGRGGGGGRSRRDGNGDRRVYISNVPYEMRWQDIKDLFREQVGEVTYVELFETPDGKSNGTGVIEFRDASNARKAIDEMNKYEFKGRKIIVREERESDRRRHMRNMDFGNDGGNMGMGGGGVMGMGGGGNMAMGAGNMGMGGGANMAGGNMGMGGGGGGNANFNNAGSGGNVSQQILQQLGIDGPVTNQVFVANLDYVVTKDKLHEIFKMAGNVIRAELKTDKDGSSRGMGIVQFEHPMEAIQAISMFNGQLLYERSMSVRMDKMADMNSSKPPALPSGLKSIGMGLGTGGNPLTNISQLASQVNMSSMLAGSISTGMNSNMGMANQMPANNPMTPAMNPGMGGMMGNTGMGGMGDMGAMNTGMNQMGNMGLGNTGMGNAAMGNTGMGGNTGFLGTDNMAGLGAGLGLGNMGNTGLGNMGNMGAMGSMNTGLAAQLSNNMDNFMGNAGMGGRGVGGNMDNFNRGGNQGMGRQNNSGGGGGMRRGQEGCMVFVRNLPYSVTWQNLKERFRDCGEVKFAEIKLENGKSRGCGTVRFTSPDDARRAINVMNGTRIDGREIEVRLER